MSIPIIDTLNPLGNFPAVNASDVQSGNKRLDAKISEIESNAFSGNYNDLSNKPNIPTKTSQITNDSGFISEHQDISNKADISVVTDISDRVSSVESEQEVINSRMDTFTTLPEGSTSGDAELMDIRVGDDSVTYTSAGTAVRSQISNVKSNLSSLSDDYDTKVYVDKDINVFNKNNATLNKSPNQGSTMYDLVNSENVYTSEIYKVNSGDVFTFNAAWITVYFYDESGNYITHYTDNTIRYVTPQNAKYARISSTLNSSTYFHNLVLVINSVLPDRPVPYRGESVKDVCERIEGDVESKSVNIFDKSLVVKNKSYVQQTNTSTINTVTDSSNIISSQLFAVTSADVIRVNKPWGTYLFYNQNGLYLRGQSTADLQFTIASDVKYMRFMYPYDNGFVDTFMMTKNNVMPSEYTPYGYISNINKISDRLSKVEKSIDPTNNVAIVIINYDQGILENDNRISIMDTYGWKPSFTAGVNDNITNKMLEKGWDLTTYWAVSNVPTDEQLSEDSQTALEACKLYVKTALNDQENHGYFNPTAWMCRQNKYGPTLGKALKYYGYKIVRGGSPEGTFSKNINKDFTQTVCRGIYTNNLAQAKADVDTAVANNSVVSIFTHYVVDTIEEDRGYDCLKSVYIELMEYIKALENQGKVVVMNYRDFYASRFPEISAENDYNRIIKRMNYIASKIN